MIVSKVVKLSLILFGVLLSAQMHSNVVVAESAPVTVGIDHDDGGKTEKRHADKLLRALVENGCSVVSHNQSANEPAQMIFDSRPVSIVRNERPDYVLIARAITLDGEKSVQGAILVHSSTGIDNLKVLDGERIAFVGKSSWSGYHMPLQALHDAGVFERMNTFFYVGNHVGTVSMLLHNDVFVAVAAEPLAKRWAKANNLTVVAVSEAVETGGWWMRHNLPERKTKICKQALKMLERSEMKALPAWIGGFVVSQ